MCITTRSCIGLFVRVWRWAFGRKLKRVSIERNMRADEAAPVRSRRSSARATNSGRATSPASAAVFSLSSPSVLTSYSRCSDTSSIVSRITSVVFLVVARSLVLLSHPPGVPGVQGARQRRPLRGPTIRRPAGPARYGCCAVLGEVSLPNR